MPCWEYLRPSLCSLLKYGIERETKGFQPSDEMETPAETFTDVREEPKTRVRGGGKKSGQLIETLKKTFSNFFEQIS